ncbi:hypothetical protein [Celerinatantimonas sp. MCCC 1A17872]|uniref:hypothetical protein n=1 Tax=Celerinatantimonas sp. MCCC 1A17872 TaxID=3177514 RepID=UPI0038BF7B9B
MSSIRTNGNMALFLGITRSGKSVPVKRISEKWTRVLVYDPKGEYHLELGFEQANTRRELLDMLKAATGPAKINYMGISKSDFLFFCDCAFNWNHQKEAMIICEELASVTNAGKADGAWNRLINQSMAFGPLVVGTVQRGQEVDKSLLNSANFVHVAQHGTDDDAYYIAKKLGVPMEEIPREPLKFFQWTANRGIVVRGHVDFKGAKGKLWDDGTPRFIRASNGKPMKFNRAGRFDGVAYC